ncbi:BREX-2 system phosphatase PglZ [Prauserella halophila]|uniref:BREX-2 system phosphatase PglZ n=1 Tax=Prauserella halophila TaxID=185641 RepID=A0ABN1W3P8_9PSEU|nr:BREX-2 system phosphatase PglZ [Prauserella halophila]MCP2235243.1 PglZ domain-containing protein [Prauserella halophila]
MAVTVDGHTLMTASPAVVRALLDSLVDKNYRGGVLGVQAGAEWDGPEQFTHRGRAVRVAACPSTLAVWEALHGAPDVDWVVVLTPCTRDDLGGGVLAHLLGNRLRTPDPWQAVQQRFGAERLDSQLQASGDKPRELAGGLLATLAEHHFPPAPGGVLTRDHALGSVARAKLGIAEDGAEVDITSIMVWTVTRDATSQLANLRKSGGDALTEEVIDWLAGHCGLAAHPVRTLLSAGRVADIVPLGIVAGLLNSPELSASHAAGQFAGTYGLGRLNPSTLASWNAEAAGLVTTWLDREAAHEALHSANGRVRELGLTDLVRTSDLLPDGLNARLSDLAEAIRPLVAEVSAEAAEPDTPLVTGDLTAAEAALANVRGHYLAAGDDTVRSVESAMRLVRWLAVDTSVAPAEQRDLGALLRRHTGFDSWVDSAVNDVARGAADTTLAEELGRVLALVRTRRDAHDRAFGNALANASGDGVLGVEQVLPTIVAPLANRQPTLLLVIDGLSMAIASKLVDDAGRIGWVEHALPGNSERGAALAVLPTLTEFSRTSLLCGELRHGNDDAESQGFAEQLKRAGLPEASAGGAKRAPLYHKKDLDTSAAGHALSSDIQNAVADTARHPLVGAVLNTVDDALHHTDPAGIDWNLGAVKHLKPLLEAARRAGRSVVITSDHGHVIERREGELHQHDATYGARARADVTAEPPTDGEVLVRGPRVLTAGGSAVLAVNERLRYGPLNAGYHGGGCPAEVVVPVVVLHAGQAPPKSELGALPDPKPEWWDRPVPAAAATPPAVTTAEPAQPDALFDLAPAKPTAAETEPDAVDAEAKKLAKAVLASKTFKQQVANAKRMPVREEHIRALLEALLSNPERRIPAKEACTALGVHTSRLRGALSLLKRLLDIEGYVVIQYEQESGDVVLDETTLREQFGVTR